MSRAFTAFLSFNFRSLYPPGREYRAGCHIMREKGTARRRLERWEASDYQESGALESDTRTASSVPIYMYGFVDTNSHLAKKKN